MAREITEKDTRVTADFSPEAYATLSRVAKRLQTTKAEALRKALSLLDFVLGHQTEGWKLVLEHEKTNERKYIVTL